MDRTSPGIQIKRRQTAYSAFYPSSEFVFVACRVFLAVLNKFMYKYMYTYFEYVCLYKFPYI